jgi:hypothetical protein
MKNDSITIGLIFLFTLMINLFGYMISRSYATSEEYFHTSYSNTMKQSDAESVIAIIQAETFDNAFSHYSSYRDISDTKFHDLRKSYLAARNELMDYINEAAHTKIEVPYYLAEYK